MGEVRLQEMSKPDEEVAEAPEETMGCLLLPRADHDGVRIE
jgi:hypothetical protein